MKAKVFSILALLLMAAPGAWADDEVTLMPQGANAWTLTMPASDVELEIEYKVAATISYAETDIMKTRDDEAFINDLTNAGDGSNLVRACFAF